MTYDINTVRAGFPALSRTQNNNEVAYLDGPGGTQVHCTVIEAMTGFMERGGSNHGGSFITSVETGAVVDEARSGVADLLGADENEIVFGQNMTSLTYSMSRALGRTWEVGDNIICTRLDHDANVAPWIQAARDTGVEVRFVDFDPTKGCRLDLSSLENALDERTRLAAFTHASNAVGTITPVTEMVEMAHSVGALTYVDAVHYAPHGVIDVRSSNTDFLVSSAYKWFGPHTGCLYGRAEILDSVEPYKLRPASDSAPDRWETGTQSFESLAGVTAAVDYIASLGEGRTRRERIISSYLITGEYEETLSERFLRGLDRIDGVRLYGEQTVEGRTPTFAIDVEGVKPNKVERALGSAGCFVWSGDYYAYEVMARLNKSVGGLVRIGFTHYNTTAEVDRVLEEIEKTKALKR